MTEPRTPRQATFIGAGLGAGITALLFTAGIGVYSLVATPSDKPSAPTTSQASTLAPAPETAWPQEQQAMAHYIAADTVSRYLSEYEVTRQWQDSLGHWGTESFKEKARYIDPSLNQPGDIVAITASNFALQNSATITVESTAGTFTLTLVPDGDEVKVDQLKVN